MLELEEKVESEAKLAKLKLQNPLITVMGV